MHNNTWPNIRIVQWASWHLLDLCTVHLCWPIQLKKNAKCSCCCHWPNRCSESLHCFCAGFHYGSWVDHRLSLHNHKTYFSSSTLANFNRKRRRDLQKDLLFIILSLCNCVYVSHISLFRKEYNLRHRNTTSIVLVLPQSWLHGSYSSQNRTKICEYPSHMHAD